MHAKLITKEAMQIGIQPSMWHRFDENPGSLLIVTNHYEGFRLLIDTWVDNVTDY